MPEQRSLITLTILPEGDFAEISSFDISPWLILMFLRFISAVVPT
jgi:hypothetical protein